MVWGDALYALFIFLLFNARALGHRPRCPFTRQYQPFQPLRRCQLAVMRKHMPALCEHRLVVPRRTLQGDSVNKIPPSHLWRRRPGFPSFLSSRFFKGNILDVKRNLIYRVWHGIMTHSLPNVREGNASGRGEAVAVATGKRWSSRDEQRCGF